MSLLPLEANPDVMNKLLTVFGVSEKWSIVDVFGLEEDTLAWVPRPVLGLILLCPGTDQFLNHADQEISKIKEAGQTVDPDLFFMRQCVRNTCGTVALVHCVANNIEKLEISDGPFKTLLEEAKKLTPEQRGELIFKSDAFNLINAHQELAMEGQTEANHYESTNNHFMALVEKGGHLYKLNGTKEMPINLGPTTTDTFLDDAAKVCKEFIAREGDAVNFTILALAAADN